MRTAVLILLIGALGVSSFYLMGAAEAQVRLPQKPDPCKELRLEIEEWDADGVPVFPKERLLLGLFCAHAGDPGPIQLVPVPVVPAPSTHVGIIMRVDQEPPNGDDNLNH